MDRPAALVDQTQQRPSKRKGDAGPSNRGFPVLASSLAFFTTLAVLALTA